MKIKSAKNIIAIGALAIMLFGTQKVFAYVPGVWDPQPRVQTSDQSAFTEIPAYDTTPVPQPTNSSFVVAPSPVVTYVYEQAPKQTQVQTASNVVYKMVTTNSTTATPASSNLPPVVSSDQQYQSNGFAPTATNNNLSALSLNGSGGFMPSSVWQWILIVFLILIIIIIARLFKKPEPHHVAVY